MQDEQTSEVLNMKDCKSCHFYYNGKCISDECIQGYYEIARDFLVILKR